MDKHKFQGKYCIESTRLKDYDYSRNGAYFVTICTKNSTHLFGSIVDQKLISTRQAEVVTEYWLDLCAHYTNCTLDKFIIMPNHVPGLKLNNTSVETGLKPVSPYINSQIQGHGAPCPYNLFNGFSSSNSHFNGFSIMY